MKIILLAIMAGCFLDITCPSSTSAEPNADSILVKVQEGFRNVLDFSVTIDAEIKMERVQIPRMNALMYFKKPDKIHFSSKSFLLVPRDGIALNPDVLTERYDASSLGAEIVDGVKLYKLQLAAKEKKTRLRQLYVWINSTHWTISKIETIPYEGRTLSIVFRYERYQEKFWLPSQLIASFGSTTGGTDVSGDSTVQSGNSIDQMQRGVPKTGSITILYSNYKVNTGIDDAVFESKEQ
jgi:outer membrane lipoprotein-sorting protein